MFKGTQKALQSTLRVGEAAHEYGLVGSIVLEVVKVLWHAECFQMGRQWVLAVLGAAWCGGDTTPNSAI